MSDKAMIPSRPYLLRAMHEWIVDNGLTPYILVDAKQDGVQVPAGYVQDDRIVLNISPRAVQGYHQDNEWILFNARFNGQSLPLSVPIKAVLAIYARENGQGMMFDSEEQVMTAALAPASPAAAKRPHLQLVE